MIQVFIASLLYLMSWFTGVNNDQIKDLEKENVQRSVSEQRYGLIEESKLDRDTITMISQYNMKQLKVVEYAHQYNLNKPDNKFYNARSDDRNLFSNIDRFESIKFEVINKDLTFEIGL